MPIRASAIRCMVLLLPLASACQPQARPPVTGRLDAAGCRPPAANEARRLPTEWAQFQAHVKVCDVADGNGKTPLSLFAISATDYYEKLPSGATTVTMPRPILFNATGEQVGTLPYGFPDDPPFSLQVTFADWTDGWPARIELFLQDPTVTGDHALAPLVWDPASRRFAEKL